MATSRKVLFKTNLVATTDTELYETPVDTNTSITISMCNRGLDTTFRLAITSGSAPVSGEYIYYDLPIAANETRMIEGIVLDAGKAVWAYSGTADVDFVATGLEVA